MDAKAPFVAPLREAQYAIQHSTGRGEMSDHLENHLVLFLRVNKKNGSVSGSDADPFGVLVKRSYPQALPY